MLKIITLVTFPIMIILFLVFLALGVFNWFSVFALVMHFIGCLLWLFTKEEK